MKGLLGSICRPRKVLFFLVARHTEKTAFPIGQPWRRMKYLGIDYGQKRTGIAVTDPEAVMAFPRRTLIMRGKDAFFEELLALAAEEKVDAFVVGLPLRGDGSDSETTRQARNMAERLKRRTVLPVYLMEETLSSHDAAMRLREAGHSGKSAAARLDQAAAVAILESFLSQPEHRRIRA